MKQPEEKLTVLEVLMKLPKNDKRRFVDSLGRKELRLGSPSRNNNSGASSMSPQSYTDAKPLYDSEPNRPHKEISMEEWEALLRDY